MSSPSITRPLGPCATRNPCVEIIGAWYNDEGTEPVFVVAAAAISTRRNPAPRLRIFFTTLAPVTTTGSCLVTLARSQPHSVLS